MRNTYELPLWGRHIAVAVAYGLTFFLLGKVSTLYWFLPTGLRFGVLLLVATRYWPAILVGDLAVTLYNVWYCSGDLGVTWAIASSYPMIAFAMPIVWGLRRYLPGWHGDHYERVTAPRLVAFLVSAAGYAVVAAIVFALRAPLRHLPPDYVPKPVLLIGSWNFLGDYLGAITVAPLALMVYEIRQASPSWKDVYKQMASSSMMLEGVVLGSVGFGILAWLGSQGVASETARQVARVCMLIPLAWMAIRFGWHGAAVGVAAASTGVMLTMPSRYDVASIVAQAIMAAVATAMLPVGARMVALRSREKDLEYQALEAKLFAKRQVYRTEVSRRMQADLVDSAASRLQLDYSRLLHQLRFVLPGQASSFYREQLQSMRHHIYRMVDALSPREWQRRGLEGSLWNGPINQVLDESGIDYHVSEPQGILSELSSELKISLFRLTCEAVAYLIQLGACDQIRLRLRGGRNSHGIAWAVLSVESDNQRILESGRLVLPPEPDKLKMWLGASGLDLREMREHASLFDGKVRLRAFGKTRWRLTMALQDVHVSVENQAT